jgi:hypothetical protein
MRRKKVQSDTKASGTCFIGLEEDECKKIPKNGFEQNEMS